MQENYKKTTINTYSQGKTKTKGKEKKKKKYIHRYSKIKAKRKEDDNVKTCAGNTGNRGVLDPNVETVSRAGSVW